MSVSMHTYEHPMLYNDDKYQSNQSIIIKQCHFHILLKLILYKYYI